MLFFTFWQVGAFYPPSHLTFSFFFDLVFFNLQVARWELGLYTRLSSIHSAGMQHIQRGGHRWTWFLHFKIRQHRSQFEHYSQRSESSLTSKLSTKHSISILKALCPLFNVSCIYEFCFPKQLTGNQVTASVDYRMVVIDHVKIHAQLATKLGDTGQCFAGTCYKINRHFMFRNLTLGCNCSESEIQPISFLLWLST
jgi:hypothetical protein